MARDKIRINVELQAQMASSLKEASSTLKAMDASLQKITKSSNRASRSVNNLGSILKGAVVAFAFRKVVGGFDEIRKSAQAAFSQIVKGARDSAKARVAFTSLLGSTQDAQKGLQELTAFAKRTPLSIEGVRTSAQFLLNANVAAKEVIPTLELLAKTAVAGGGDLTNIARNFTQVIAGGRLYTRDFNQFISQGIPIISALSKVMNVAEKDVKGMVEAGAVGSEEVIKAFQSLAGEGGRLENIFSDLENTSEGSLNALQESLIELREAIGANVDQDLTGLFQGLSQFLSENKDAIIEFGTQFTRAFVKIVPSAIQVAIQALSLLLSAFDGIVKQVANMQRAFGLGDRGALAKLTKEALGFENAIKRINKQQERLSKNGGKSPFLDRQAAQFAQKLEQTYERIAELQNKGVTVKDPDFGLTKAIDALQVVIDKGIDLNFDSKAAPAGGGSSNTPGVLQGGQVGGGRSGSFLDFLKTSAKNIKASSGDNGGGPGNLLGGVKDFAASGLQSIKDFGTDLVELDSITKTMTFGETLQLVGAGLNELGINAETVTRTLTDAAAGFGNAALGFGQDFLGIIGNTNQDPKEAAVSTVKAFAKQIPVIGEAVAGVIDLLKDPDAVVKLIDGLAKALPGVIDGLVKAVPKVVKALADNFPTIIKALVDGVPDIIVALVQAIPVLLDALLAALPDVIKGLVDALPELIDAFIEAIPDIIDAIIDNLPAIIEAIIDAIPRIIVALIAALPDLLVALTQGILKLMVLSIKLAFVDIPKQIIGAITKAFAGLPQAIADAIKGAVNGAFGGVFSGGGGGTLGQVVETVGSVASPITSAVSSVFGLSDTGSTLPSRLPQKSLPTQVQNQTAQSTAMEGLLTAILKELQKPQQINTTINMDSQRLADAILELDRTGARTSQ